MEIALFIGVCVLAIYAVALYQERQDEKKRKNSAKKSEMDQ